MLVELKFTNSSKQKSGHLFEPIPNRSYLHQKKIPDLQTIRPFKPDPIHQALLVY